MTTPTTRTPRRPASLAPVLGGLLVVGPALAAGVALTLVKWLLVTAALLAVPFAIWWFVDRARRHAHVVPVTVPKPRPAPTTTTIRSTRVPAAAPVTASPSRPFLAPDRVVAVLGDEEHQRTLARHHHDRPVTRVTAELRPGTTPGGARHRERAVEVCLDGERVGELSATASARYRHHVVPGRLPACLATIAHGEHGYQIEVRLPRS